ncbi:hypothetical protein ACTFIR_002208 [Dictyostelium discoideum]
MQNSLVNNNDSLFYNKIWKNIVIRNKIIKYISIGNNRFGIIKFEKVISALFFIENGYFRQLRDKIKNSEYLVLNGIGNDKNEWPHSVYSKSSNSSNTTIYSKNLLLNKNCIFNKEKAAIHWDLHFYIDLFKNYSNYYLKSNIQETENLLIDYDNELALKVLHEHFNHKLQIDLFFKSFIIGSYECAFYLFNQLKIIKSNSLIIKIWNLLYQDIENSIELNSSSSSSSGASSISIQDSENEHLRINEKFNFLLNKLKLPLPNNQIPTPYIFNIKIYQSKLSTVLESVKIIIKIKPLFNKFIKSVNDKSYKLKNTNSTTTTTINNLTFLKEFEKVINNFEINLLELNEIENMKFSKNDLLKNIMDIDLNENENENVLKIYNLLLPFTNHFNCYLENLNYINIKYKNDYQYYSTLLLSIENSTIKIKSIINLKMFGQYKFNDLLEMGHSDDSLFKFCKNDENVKIDYINKVLVDLKSQNQPNSILIIEKLMSNFINENNLQLSRLIINQLLNNDDYLNVVSLMDKETIRLRLKRIFISMVKSIEMFDLLYKEVVINDQDLNQQLSNSILKILINNNKSIIFEHFKKNYPLEYYSSIEQLDLVNNGGVSFDVYKFVYDNIDDFISIYSMINVWSVTSLNLSIDQFIYLIQRTPKNKNYHCFNNVVFFNYIVLNLPNDIEIGKCQLDTFNKDLFNYFKIINNNNNNDNDNNNNNNNNNNNQNELIEFIDKLNIQYYVFKNSSIYKIVQYDCLRYGNTELIDLIIILYKRFENSKYWDLLRNIVSSICEIGQLNLFKYMVSNFNQDSFILENEQYNTLFRMGHIEFLEYSLNLFKPIEKIKIHYFNNNIFCLNHFKYSKNKYLDLSNLKLNKNKS